MDLQQNKLLQTHFEVERSIEKTSKLLNRKEVVKTFLFSFYSCMTFKILEEAEHAQAASSRSPLDEKKFFNSNVYCRAFTAMTTARYPFLFFLFLSTSNSESNSNLLLLKASLFYDFLHQFTLVGDIFWICYFSLCLKKGLAVLASLLKTSNDCGSVIQCVERFH